MDITEAFRTEDLSKADFFDFVVTPDNNDNQFQKQMRSVNAFLSNGSVDEKETNNNHMPTGEMTSIPASQADGNFDLNFWGDKDTVRLETAILEDLNKYCWNTDEDVVANGLSQANLKHLNNNNNNSGTTDGGHIYTLTVLNGIDQGATWYRPPLTTIIKDEDASVSSPNSMEHLQPGIDIDSILNIMPAQMNAFNNNYQESGINQTTDGMIKSETYTYEDSGFADNKDELANSLIIDTPLLETHDGYNNNNNNTTTNNNNNDWKLNNNNSNNSNSNNTNSVVTQNGSADSLLRSALQGKAFVRYNGVKKETNVELRRVLSTPPSKTETIFLKQDDNDKIPTIVAGIDANGTVIFEEQIPSNPQTRNPDNSDNSHHMDDILLSQLDQHYPEDFEKLKRIANEVAESVNQFCQVDTSVDTVYAIAPDQIGLLNSLNSPISIAPPLVTSSKPATGTPSTTTTATPTPKKYKRSNSNNNNGNNNNNNGGVGKQTTVQNATSTSNGVRKERSLHYCSICSKGFKDKYSVNVHIRTHTGEKPFACSLCGKSFRQKAHLAKHYQTHIAQKNAAAAGNVNSSKTKTR